MTDAFLAYSRLAGNDLSTPRPEYGFQYRVGYALLVIGTPT